MAVFWLDSYKIHSDVLVMNNAAEYRRLAAEARLAAANAALPNLKAVYEQAAAVWDRLADQADAWAKRPANRGGEPLGMTKPGDE